MVDVEINCPNCGKDLMSLDDHYNYCICGYEIPVISSQD